MDGQGEKRGDVHLFVYILREVYVIMGRIATLGTACQMLRLNCTIGHSHSMTYLEGIGMRNWWGRKVQGA